MEIIQNIIEYYDELYTVTEEQKKFYSNLIKQYNAPAKLLRVDCGTGYFEHYLAREGCDVTGIETYREVLKSANLRRRNQLMSVRFFEMSSLDMTRFLGKGFYNVVSCLENRIVFMHDQTLIRKFFYDAKSLLAPGGTLVLQLVNFNVFKKEPVDNLPEKQSVRARLFTELWTNANGEKFISQSVETGNGKVLPVMEDKSIYPLLPEEIERFAKEAGFKKLNFYADYSKAPFTGSEQEYVVEIQ